MNHLINFGVILKIIGLLILMVGLAMSSALPFSLYFMSGDHYSILFPSLGLIFLGILIWNLTKNSSNSVGKREGYLIVAIGWLVISFISTLPYICEGTFENFTDAFFEAVSGLTTTGASVLNDIEAVPRGILFWRSLTQWIGGMGIIILTIAIFPLLGIGGVELFVAEAPGPTSNKIHPRIREMAKRLWLIYVGLTALLTFLLWSFGMSFYDALNHGLTTMATGGFSTKNASITYFDVPRIQYTLMFFMFFAGTNYTILYYSLKGKFRKVWKNDEFKTYIGLVTLLVIFLTFMLINSSGLQFEKAFRDSAFQVLSIITTTGYVSTDYTQWGPGLTFFIFIMMFLGASAGSTSGGIKLIRHLVLVKNSMLEFKRLLHPNALIRLKIDGKIVRGRILTHVLVFLLIYLIIFVVGTLIMLFIIQDFDRPIITALGVVATSLGNVGPGIGEVGPLDNFSEIPNFGKWFLAFLMLLGRLEMFTILILFVPYFWRSN